MDYLTSDLTEELGTNFIEYSVEVNSNRAIPDAKTGLKPVAKRILWGAYQMGALSSKPHVKAATVVGEVMGKYHPHGDSSIYDAMARLSQNWVMRYPLIDWHGNNGNIIGAGPAASRYTEARLSKLSEEGMLSNIKKKNVDFELNFSDTLDEPVTLPSTFPNLLCNPNSGIGVAIACSWAPNNLGEVAQAIYDYMDGKEPSLPGPDFPTGGTVINKSDIPKIMQTGRGTVKVRGNYRIDKNKITFYELPYGVTIEPLLDELSDLCDKKEIEGISRIYDATNGKGVQVVIECDKNVAPETIVARLFAKSSLQSSFSYNQVALVNKTPVELNLKDCCKIYVDHNVDCIKRETEFDLEKVEKRLPVVEGLLIALEDIDNVIKLIKTSESAAAAKASLQSKYNLSELQAQAILDMKLSKLAHLEKIELEQEKKELIEKRDSLNALLTSTEKQLEIVKERLESLVKKYGDERRTQLTQIEVPKEKKEAPVVEAKPCVVVISKRGTVKRVDTKSFKPQKRATAGVKTNGDIVAFSQKTNTQDMLMVFTTKGKMYRILVDSLPEGTNTSAGSMLSSLIEFGDDEVPIAFTTLTRDTAKKYIFFATKNGIVKKVPLSEYDSMKRTGILAIKLKEGDELVDITFIDQEEMMLVTEEGFVIRFETKDMPISSRTAQGVKGLRLGATDHVVKCLPVSVPAGFLAIVTKDGKGKKVALSEFTTQGRGGKGVTGSKGPVAGAAILSESSNLLISGDKTSIVINSDEIPNLGRTASGNILLKNNMSVESISEV